MAPEEIDFSPLDPARDAARWDALVARTAARGLAARRARLGFGGAVLAWARPALALAAAAALVLWGAVLGAGDDGAQATTDPALALAGWASTGSLPDTATLLETMGGLDGAL